MTEDVSTSSLVLYSSDALDLQRHTLYNNFVSRLQAKYTLFVTDMCTI